MELGAKKTWGRVRKGALAMRCSCCWTQVVRSLPGGAEAASTSPGPVWHLGLLGCAWKEQRATTVFVWCGLERGLLLRGKKTADQKTLESPQRSIQLPQGFR